VLAWERSSLSLSEDVNLEQQLTLMDVTAMRNALSLNEVAWKKFMEKDPPRLDIEGSLFFKFDGEFMDWLTHNYSAGTRWNVDMKGGLPTAEEVVDAPRKD
jgi:hypothetical protein